MANLEYTPRGMGRGLMLVIVVSLVVLVVSLVVIVVSLVVIVVSLVMNQPYVQD